MAGGWCPRHDRTYARGARCPRCKTPLVALASLQPRRRTPPDPPTSPPPPFASLPSVALPRPEPLDPVVVEPVEVEPVAAVVLGDGAEEPPIERSHGRRRVRAPATVGLAILVAFAIGASVNGSEPAATSQPVASPTPAHADERPFAVSSLAGVTLRLERISQLGQRIEATFRVLDGFSASVLREVFIDVTLENGTQISISDVHVRAGRTRFSTTFLLPDATAHVTRLRITGVRTVSDASAARMTADLKGVWPVGPAGEPVTVRVDQKAIIDGSVVRWPVALLWRDRIEVILDLTDFNRSAKHFFGYTELFEDDPVAGLFPANFAGAREEGNRIHLDFGGLRDATRRIVLLVGAPTTTIDGPWSWTIRASE